MRFETNGYYNNYYIEETGDTRYWECAECFAYSSISPCRIKHKKTCKVPKKEKDEEKKYQKREKIKAKILKKLTAKEREILGFE